MEQRDYIKRQIDQFAQYLARSVVHLLNLKGTGKIESEIQQIRNSILVELDIDVFDLQSISNDDFLEKLITDNRYNRENINNLNEILFILAEDYFKNVEPAKYSHILEKSLVLCEHIHKTDTEYSIERNNRIEYIKKTLIR